MSLARAIATGDLAELPSRRDEDWRWSDIRALVRVLPAPSPRQDGLLPPGPFAALGIETIEIVNGRGTGRIDLAAGETRTMAVRFVSADAGANASRFSIHVGADACLVLL